MRVPPVLVAAVTLFALATGPARPDPTPEPLIEHVGYTMTAQEAMERIAFHPFVPSESYTEIALLPSFHGDDKDRPDNRGIGYGYTRDAIAYVLREWPRAGGSLTDYPSMRGPQGCTDAYYTQGTPEHPRAVAWQTPTLVFALQPDLPIGTNPDAHAFMAEWARLAKRGACR